jgi:hypothetical protein
VIFQNIKSLVTVIFKNKVEQYDKDITMQSENIEKNLSNYD